MIGSHRDPETCEIHFECSQPSRSPSQSPAAQSLHIVYTACGHSRLEELLRSVTSLILLTTLGQPAVQPSLHIHILSDGAVKAESLPKSPSVRYLVHQPAAQAADLFAPCSTQRMYLHEHPAFQEVDRVGPRFKLEAPALHQG